MSVSLSSCLSSSDRIVQVSSPRRLCEEMWRPSPFMSYGSLGNYLLLMTFILDFERNSLEQLFFLLYFIIMLTLNYRKTQQERNKINFLFYDSQLWDYLCEWFYMSLAFRCPNSRPIAKLSKCTASRKHPRSQHAPFRSALDNGNRAYL